MAERNALETARGWIATDEAAVLADVTRLGVRAAASWEVQLARECGTRDDRRWDGLTVAAMLEALRELRAEAAAARLLGRKGGQAGKGRRHDAAVKAATARWAGHERRTVYHVVARIGGHDAGSVAHCWTRAGAQAVRMRQVMTCSIRRVVCDSPEQAACLVGQSPQR